jgi:hypothetical protein
MKKFFSSSIFILCLQLILAQSPDEALQTVISIDVRQKSLRNVMDEIEQKASVTFSYNNATINSDSIISILVLSGDLKEILKRIMPPNTSFIISSENIILYRTPPNEQENITKEELFDRPQKDTVFPDEGKKIFTADDSVPALRIKPYVIEKLNFLEPPRHDTLAMISLAPVLFETNNEEMWQKSILKRKETPDERTVFQNNLNLYGKRKLTTKFSVGSFFQILNESMQYNNFGIGGDSINKDNANIKNIITSSEKSLTSSRTGIIASVSFEYLKLTTGFALQKSRESYNYKNVLDSTTAKILTVSDTTGFSLIGKNTYNYLSIPLFFGYERKITENLTASGNIGIWINILNSSKGCYINLNTDLPYELNDLKTAPINKTKTDMAVDISLEYKLLRNISISFSTSYMHPTNSIFEKDYPVTKFKSAFGYSFALIRKF